MTPDQAKAAMQMRLRQKQKAAPVDQAAADEKAAYDALHPGQAEFEALPIWQRPLVAMDDLVRLAAQGASYGSLDRALGDEEAAKTAKARERAGFPGTIAELSGAVVSPVTRGIGAIGSAIAPVAKGLFPAIGRAAVSTGEGAAIGGTEAVGHGAPDRLNEFTTTGGSVGLAAHLASKGVPLVGRYAAGILSGKEPDLFTKAFKAGAEGGDVAKSFRAGQKGEPITDAMKSYEAFDEAIKPGAVPIKDLMDNWKAMKKGLTETVPFKKGGVPRISDAGMRKVEKMDTLLDKVKSTPNPRRLDAVRQNFQQFAKDKDPQVSRLATTVQDNIRKEVDKVSPGYIKGLSAYENSKLAQAAGKQLSKMLPSGGVGRLFGVLPLGSPRGFGAAAYVAGKVKPKKFKPGKAAVLPFIGEP